MDEDLTPLAAGFAAATADQWRSVVQRTLKGAEVESLVSDSAGGLRLRPLYTADDVDAGAPAPRSGTASWQPRSGIEHPDPSAAREAVRHEINGGAGSLLIKIDPSGKAGVAMGAGDALAELLAGVTLETTPVALDAGFLGVAAGGWLAAAAKGSPAAIIDVHLDPLSAFARSGASPGPIESHLIAGAGLAARLAEPYPLSRAFLGSGRVVHEAGGSAAWELAFAVAASLAYAKAQVRAGLSTEMAFARTSLGLAVDSDPLVSIAKLRAARIVWASLTGACGVDGAAVIETRSSGRMLASADPWTNLVRLTAAGHAAAVGGADSVVLGAFTDSIGPATPFARRLSRNIQLILAEEANVGRVVDPAGGAWAFEALTHDLAAEAWSRFQTIEAAGGIVEALRSGMVAREIEQDRSTLSARIASGEIKIVGVTDFAHPLDRTPDVDSPKITPVEGPSPRVPGPDSHCPALTPIRLEGLAA